MVWLIKLLWLIEYSHPKSAVSEWFDYYALKAKYKPVVNQLQGFDLEILWSE
jgi:hypothetical protein